MSTANNAPNANLNCFIRCPQMRADAIIRIHNATTHYKVHMQFRASDGLTLAYTIDDFTDPWPHAPTLRLLHASMAHSKRYYASLPKRCRHYCCVRLDLRGHGQSQVPPAEPP